MNVPSNFNIPLKILELALDRRKLKNRNDTSKRKLSEQLINFFYGLKLRFIGIFLIHSTVLYIRALNKMTNVLLIVIKLY